MQLVTEAKKRRTRRVLRVAAWVVCGLVALSGALLAAGNAYLNRLLPQVEGTVALAGLEMPVRVVRDRHGVPHIYAESERDLFMAQGYVTAQDRLFQMDLSRRQASGRLSEVVGEATVERDKFFRTLGLRRAAEASYAVYSDHAKQVLQWYADGVNAFIEQARREGRLPIEFRIMGYEPEPWTPVDSLAIGKFMAFDLGGHWEGQAFRYWLLQTFPEEKAYDLFPVYPDGAPVIVPPGGEAVDVPASFAAAVVPPPFHGSNNWVVSGAKSASGKPLLANDPHLDLGAPSIWYQTHLHAPTVNVSGVIFAGVPGVILGHNEHIAWGVTNTGPDVQDLYIEKRNPDNPRQFLYNGRWEEAQIVDEPIRVKGGETIPYQVTITRHGPVISEFAHESGKDTVFSLRWTALEPSRELEAVLNFNKARNWQEFEAALEDFHAPAQNFVFAAADGTIAYKANGKIPIRGKGDALLPVPGWTDEYEWKGYIPFDQLPRAVNPPEGFLATANNKVTGDDYPYHLSHIWAQPYRQMRIREVLSGKERFTVEDMQRLQMDVANLQAREFVPVFLAHLDRESLGGTERQAVELLEAWDFTDDKDSAAPLVFHTWMRHVGEVLFADSIPAEMMDLFEGKDQVVDELIRRAHRGEPGPWIREKGGLSAVLRAALTAAVTEIAERHGGDPARWTWGDAHRVGFRHPLSSIAALRFLFNGSEPLPVGGSRVTVMAAGWNRESGLSDHGPAWRFVADTADLSKAYHVVGPGQSGMVKSRWYFDQAQDWVEGRYHETTLDVRPDGVTLTLEPHSKEAES